MKIIVKISEVENEATITVEKNEDEETVPIIDDLKEALKNEGVTEGINESKLAMICFDQKFNEEIIIAGAVEPKSGKNAEIEEVNVPLPFKKVKPVKKEDGGLDYYAQRKGLITLINKGDTIIKKIPPTVGESGKTVKGEEIPGLEGNDMLLEQFCGPNTEIADNAIVASINGIVKFEDNRYTVEKELKLNCDIGVETGAINIPKDLDITLIIDGDVQDGYTITCPTLKISGCVEDSTVDVNNLYIDNGIVGTSDKPIRADVLKVGYINGTRKVFAHTIKVQREISNGASITADTLQVNTIQGSYVMAKEGILVDYIKGVNHITVGIDYDLKKEFDDIANEMKVFENEINEMKNESYKIAKKMEKMRQLAKINPKNPTLAVEMKKIKEFKEKFDSRTKYYNELEENKKDRAKKMYLFTNHFLVVKSGFSTDTSSDQSVEPDTNLRICTHVMKVNRPTSGGLFKANESKINFSSKYNLKEIKDIIENKFK